MNRARAFVCWSYVLSRPNLLSSGSYIWPKTHLIEYPCGPHHAPFLTKHTRLIIHVGESAIPNLHRRSAQIEWFGPMPIHPSIKRCQWSPLHQRLRTRFGRPLIIKHFVTLDVNLYHKTRSSLLVQLLQFEYTHLKQKHSLRL